VIDLKETSPLIGLSLPVTIGTATISERILEHATSIAPFQGQDAKLSAVLNSHIGLDLPAVGHASQSAQQELFWCGQGQYMLTSPSETVQSLAPHLGKLAALSDQSDAWAVLELRGTDASLIVARLCPLDMRGLKEGHAARSEFAHMMSIIQPRQNGYDIWVMRSFGKTALHHLTVAAKSIAALT